MNKKLVAKTYIYISLAMSVTMAMFAVYAAIQHNSYEEYCIYTTYPECDYRYGAIALLFCSWLVVTWSVMVSRLAVISAIYVLMSRFFSKNNKRPPKIAATRRYPKLKINNTHQELQQFGKTQQLKRGKFIYYQSWMHKSE